MEPNCTYVNFQLQLCDRITRRLRTEPRFEWVGMVAVAHAVGGMMAFALYHTRPWVTLAFMPLALELTALGCALFKAAAAQGGYSLNISLTGGIMIDLSQKSVGL